MADLPTARASDAERDRVVSLLREHTVAGRLTLDEFSDRMSTALEARTRGELEPVLENLPAVTAPAPSVGSRRVRRRVVAFMSGEDVKGRWRVAEHTTAMAIMGGCKLDLRAAEIEGAEIRITAWAIWGGVQIVLPEGIDVEVTGLSVMGGRSVHVKDVPIIPGSPRVIIRAIPIMGGVTVRSRPPRRLSLDTGSRGQSAGSSERPEIASAHSGSSTRPPGAGSTAAVSPSAFADSSPAGAGPTGSSVAAPSPAVRDLDDGSAEEPLPGSGARGAELGVDGTVTILFSDISDFSGLTERLGDRVVQDLVIEHRDIVRSYVDSHGGREVKAQGDGFMLAFAGVARALRCARDIQRCLAERAVDRPDRAISVHMGLHTGEALADGDDYIGHTVIVASRLADAAAPGEVLVSSTAKHLVARNAEFSFGLQREMPLKGLKDLEAAAPFVWDGSDGTAR